MSGFDSSRSAISRYRGIAFGVAGLGLVGTVAGLFADPTHIYQSYLIAFLFWNGIAVGFLGLLLLHHMVGGEWGYTTRRFLESGAMVIPVMGVFSIPILMGTTHLFLWANPDNTKESFDTILHAKSPYLNLPFFYARMAIYFLFWTVSAFLLNKWSKECDETGTPMFRTKARVLSGPGILLYALIFTFYAVDLVMSLEPHWISTIFPLLIMIGGALTALCITVLMMKAFEHVDPISSVINSERFHDFGNLILAFTCVWTYFSFSQYLISWSGNLPHEAGWYLKRTEHGWEIIAMSLMLFHFALPFFLLLQRAVTLRAEYLCGVVTLILVMRFLDVYWFVKPAFAGTEMEHFSWTDIATVVGLGGVFFSAFFVFLGTKSLLPVYQTHHEGAPVKSEVFNHG